MLARFEPASAITVAPHMVSHHKLSRLATYQTFLLLQSLMFGEIYDFDQDLHGWMCTDVVDDDDRKEIK